MQIQPYERAGRVAPYLLSGAVQLAGVGYRALTDWQYTKSNTRPTTQITRSNTNTSTGSTDQYGLWNKKDLSTTNRTEIKESYNTNSSVYHYTNTQPITRIYTVGARRQMSMVPYRRAATRRYVRRQLGTLIRRPRTGRLRRNVGLYGTYAPLVFFFNNNVLL